MAQRETERLRRDAEAKVGVRHRTEERPAGRGVESGKTGSVSGCCVGAQCGQSSAVNVCVDVMLEFEWFSPFSLPRRVNVDVEVGRLLVDGDEFVLIEERVVGRVRHKCRKLVEHIQTWVEGKLCRVEIRVGGVARIANDRIVRADGAVEATLNKTLARAIAAEREAEIFTE